MKRLVSRVLFAIAAATIGVLPACTQMPTEKQGVADIRPQISFKLEKDELAQAQVRINGLVMGQAGDFRDGQSSLRLISGTHHLQVLLGSQVVLDERFYVADGVNKFFILK